MELGKPPWLWREREREKSRERSLEREDKILEISLSRRLSNSRSTKVLPTLFYYYNY